MHGDFFRGNVLVADGRVAGLVDWEEAHVDWFTAELANGVWEFCKREDLRRRARRARPRRSWPPTASPAAPRAADDDDLLVPLIRAKRVLEVLRAPTDRQVDWDYQRRNLAAFRALGDC